MKLRLLSLALLLPLQSYAETLEIATFNVEWFGSPYTNPRSTNPTPTPSDWLIKRTQIFKDFVKQEFRPKDIAIFEEVVDVDLLKSTLPDGWTCTSYHNPNPVHQKVVACVSRQYTLSKVQHDDNFQIEEVATDADWSRPALRLDVKNKKGKILLRVVGVHLKSGPAFSQERIRQTNAIADDLYIGGNQIPIVVLGDMNTFFSTDTGMNYDDIDKITETLSDYSGSKFRDIAFKEAYTYRKGRYKSKFDHIIVNDKVKSYTTPEVFEVCNSDNQIQKENPYLNLDFYNQYISDHCFVKTNIKI